MKTSDDIELPRSAEQEAQAIIATAKQEAKRIRSETEARVAELTQKAEAELASMRASSQSDARKDVDVLLAESREQIARACKDVSIKLETGKADAVETVIGELRTR